MKINPHRMIAAGLIAACGMTFVSCTLEPSDGAFVDYFYTFEFIFSTKVCAVWKESEVKERAAYTTSAQYVAANQRQLNTRLAQAEAANKILWQVVTRSEVKVSAKDKKKAKEAINENLKLMEADIQTAQTAAKEARGTERKTLRRLINELTYRKLQLQKNIAVFSDF